MNMRVLYLIFSLHVHCFLCNLWVKLYTLRFYINGNVLFCLPSVKLLLVALRSFLYVWRHLKYRSNSSSNFSTMVIINHTKSISIE